MPAKEFTRRQFLAGSVSLGFVAALTRSARAGGPSAAPHPTYRAAIIGHTGRGNYGHSLDLIFNDRPNIVVVAIADPDAAGRAKAAARCQAQRQYADYREMLERERPQLVSVAPRWTDQHHAMALAALRSGAHIYIEKPIAPTLAEADEMLSVAAANGRKIAVAHQMRLAPNIQFLKQRLAAGELGELLELRAHGKQDRRAGGEDLLVLGTHLFDLMRLFAGDPLWCSARVLNQGQDLTRADAHPASENIGPVAGDNIFAQFAFPHGVNATFTSRADNRDSAGPWGMELVGTKSSVRILADIFPTLRERKAGGWSASGQTVEWRPMPGDPAEGLSPAEKSPEAANRRVVDDWLAAIAANREPICSGHDGMKAVEMAHAVFTAGLTRERVSFPLANRSHPLAA